MKIGIMGSGSVGATLGKRWAEKGHTVIFGARDPQSAKMKDLLAGLTGAVSAATVREAAAAADVVILATPWNAAREVIESAGNLTGKVVVDCTNPLQPQLAGLAIGTTTSAAEQVAGWARGAKVVKAFNTTGAENMGNPRYPSGPLTMFVAGDDAGAKQTVQRLAEDLGFEAVDAGPLSAARYLEPFAMLWIHLAYRQGFGRDFGFKLVRR